MINLMWFLIGLCVGLLVAVFIAWLASKRVRRSDVVKIGSKEYYEAIRKAML